MNIKGCRLRAKGEKIELDTEDGKKEYTLKPIKNKQLLVIVEMADKKQELQAAILMAKHCLNEDPKIKDGTEEAFTDEEMNEMETPFLLKIMKTAAKVNGLEEMFDFQSRVGSQLPSQESQKESKDTFQVLNDNPKVKLS